MKKKVRIHLLATESIDYYPHIGIYHDNGKKSLCYITGNHNNNALITSQHIYFTSDEKIEEGDWFLGGRLNQLLFKADANYILNSVKEDYRAHRKIVATTDTSLWEHDDTVPYPKTRPALPQIPKSFIQEYVESDIKIEEVKIEYNNGCDTCNGNRKICLQRENEPFQNLVKEECNSFYKIKTDSNNCVIISKSKNDVVTK